MKKQVTLLREDMDTRDVKYHVQEPLDLAWRAPDDTQSPVKTAPAGSSSTTPDAFFNLPFRPGASRATRNLYNPNLTNVARDSSHAPLMTDGGFFMDSRFIFSRFDGISSTRAY